MSAVIESGVTVVKSGEGTDHWVLGDRVTAKLGPEHTGGAFVVSEVAAQPGGGPPPHVHHREDEMFFVLDGEFSFLLADRTYRGTPGSCVYLPKGTPHTFKNVGEREGRFLAFAMPCGFERFIASVSSPTPPTSPEINPADVQRLLAGAAKFGIDMNPALPGAPQDGGPCPDGDCRWVMGMAITILLGAAETGGNFTVSDIRCWPGRDGPPPHSHREMDELFYVLEGTFEFLVDGRVETHGPGTLVYVPRGVAHTFRNADPTRLARLFDLHTPGGFEVFFREAGGPAADVTACPPAPAAPPDMAAMLDLLDRHGMDFAG
jgi:mannose-6-phosphate isomerase-like protein (cupin superfamily)